MLISKSYVLSVVFLMGLCSGCQRNDNQKLTVAVASNMQHVMHDLVERFTKKFKIECNLVVGSSGKLTAQIIEGAPFDLFASANLIYPTKLYGLELSNEVPKVFCYGELVVWAKNRNHLISITDFGNDEIKHIALANPKMAPYGIAGKEVLENYSIFDSINEKLVYGESIAQVNQFLLTGNAQVGFTSKSFALQDKGIQEGHWLEIDQSHYTPIHQSIVILNNRDVNIDHALKFYNFIFSNEAHEILLNNGYRSVLNQ